MNYKDLPIFKDITPEIEAYLDKLDAELAKNKQKIEKMMRSDDPVVKELDDNDILLRKIDFYYSYRDEQNSDLKRKKANKESKFQEKIDKLFATLSGNRQDNGSPRIPFMLNGIYDVRRKVDNDRPMNEHEYENMIQKWSNKNDGFNVTTGSHGEVSGWIYKIPPKYLEDKKQGKPVHRFILNVDPNGELFDKLDEFARKYGCEYKCAETIHTAYDRPDTIVMYTADDRIKEQKQELTDIIKPWVRKKGDNLLDGEKIADGLYTAKEVDRADIESLIKKLQTVYPRVANNLQNELDAHPNSSHPLSLGEFQIYQDIYDSAKMIKEQANQHFAENSLKSKPKGSETTPVIIREENGEKPVMSNQKNMSLPKEAWKKTLLASWNSWVQKNNKKIHPITEGEHSEKLSFHIFDNDKDKENYVSATKVTYTDPKNISVKAPKGKVPTQEVFAQILKNAKVQSNSIQFGTKMSPKFKANLMLACLKDPDIKIVNPPSTEEIRNWPQNIQDEINKAAIQAEMRNKTETKDMKAKYTAHDMLKEGITLPYSKSEDIKKFAAMPELANTETIKTGVSLNESDTDLMVIKGRDKNGKPTFTLEFNRKTRIYSYQGGKPEKTYSNNPKLNFPPLPAEALSSLAENQRRAMHTARVQAEMRNGVEFIEGDKKISVKQTKEGKSEKYTVVETSAKDGKVLSKFALDKSKGTYIARDYETGTIYNNSKAVSNAVTYLPQEKLLKYKSRIAKAENIAATQLQVEGNDKTR